MPIMIRPMHKQPLCFPPYFLSIHPTNYIKHESKELIKINNPNPAIQPFIAALESK